jgi:hypothetical protein
MGAEWTFILGCVARWFEYERLRLPITPDQIVELPSAGR